jgi:hypothetical protein
MSYPSTIIVYSLRKGVEARIQDGSSVIKDELSFRNFGTQVVYLCLYVRNVLSKVDSLYFIVRSGYGILRSNASNVRSGYGILRSGYGILRSVCSKVGSGCVILRSGYGILSHRRSKVSHRCSGLPQMPQTEQLLLENGV